MVWVLERATEGQQSSFKKNLRPETIWAAMFIFYSVFSICIYEVGFLFFSCSNDFSNVAEELAKKVILGWE